MYASTEPSDLRLSVLWIDRGLALPDDLGSILGPTRLVFLTRGGPRALDPKTLPHDELVVLSKLSKDLRVTRNRRNMHLFISLLGDSGRHDLGADPAFALLLLSELRIDPRRQITYARTSVYLDSTTGVVKIGVFNSDQMTQDRLLAEIRRHLPPSSSPALERARR